MYGGARSGRTRWHTSTPSILGIIQSRMAIEGGSGPSRIRRGRLAILGADHLKAPVLQVALQQMARNDDDPRQRGCDWIADSWLAMGDVAVEYRMCVSQWPTCRRVGSAFPLCSQRELSFCRPSDLMKVSDLRGILQYVPRFRERIFVVAIDGEIVASPNFANILLDLAVLRSLSIKVILVHGASAQIAQLAAERGAPISNADGTGITDEADAQASLASGDQRASTRSCRASPRSTCARPTRMPSSRIRRASSAASIFCTPAASSAWTRSRCISS